MMVQHRRCLCMRFFFSGIPVERIENGLEMLQGLLIIQVFPPKHMIFLLCSFELAFVCPRMLLECSDASMSGIFMPLERHVVDLVAHRDMDEGRSSTTTCDSAAACGVHPNLGDFKAEGTSSQRKEKSIVSSFVILTVWFIWLWRDYGYDRHTNYAWWRNAPAAAPTTRPRPLPTPTPAQRAILINSLIKDQIE